MSDFISQDDIDALLGAALSGDISTSTHVETPNADNSKKVAESIVECYNEHVKSAGKLNLSRDIAIDIDYVDNVNSETITEKVDGEYIIVEIPFTGACEGSMRVLASKQTFATLADLMVAGDGKSPYSDEHKDAITELFSQISGAFSTDLGGKFQKSVSAAAPAIFDNAGIDILENDFAAFCTLTMNDFDPMVFIVSPDETLLEKYAPLLDKPEPQNSAAPAAAAGAGYNSNAPAESHAPAHHGAENVFSSRAPKINVDILLDIELEVTIELGRTELAIKRVLDMAPGTLIELDRLSGEPVELLVNNKVVAKGEVVIIDENFGVRIISLVSPEERIRSLR